MNSRNALEPADGGGQKAQGTITVVPPNTLFNTIVGGARTYPLTVLVAAIVAFSLFVVVLAHYPKSYTSTALITPPSELDRLNVQSGLSSSIGSGSSLAGLAGFAGGPQSASQTRYETFVTLLTSRRVAGAMIRDHDALRILYAKSWDAKMGTWKKPSGTLPAIRQWISSSLGFPGWSPPDASVLAKYMEGHLKVSQSLKTTQRTLLFKSKSPELANNLLSWAMEESDAAVRADALARANEQLRYLNDQLATTMSTAENRAILSEIMMGTERSVFLASTGSTFAEQVIQPPETSNNPSSPPMVPALVIGMLTSIGVGLLCAVFRAYLMRRRAQTYRRN